MEHSIIIFASGNGSNAIQIIEHGHKTKIYQTSCIVCNNPNAKIIDYANKNNIPVLMISKLFFNDDRFLEAIAEYDPQLLVLAGFLWMIPTNLIHKYPISIINIHPSLLPKFGGKGMYSMHVHEAVIEAKEQETGITIHLVNEEYDKGKIILQKKVAVLNTDNAESIAKKVLALEHLWYKQVIENFMKQMA